MTTCRKCNKNLQNTWKFCPTCGLRKGTATTMEEMFTEIQEQFNEFDQLFGQEHYQDDFGTSIQFNQLQPLQNKITLKKRPPFSSSMIKAGLIEEPQTKVRRLTNHVIYTIKVPGIQAKKDVHVDQRDNTTEFKAYGKDKVYFKLLNISLPIASYDVKKDEVIIKFKPVQ